jgi:hypothetical protein
LVNSIFYLLLSLQKKSAYKIEKMETPFNIVLFKDALDRGEIMWRKHAAEKMLQRDILRQNVIDILQSGECIQSYDTDKPFASALFLGFIGIRPLHVVASFDESASLAYIITAYSPNLTIFESDFKTKRK